MKIDFNYKFKTLAGEIIPEGPDTIEETADGKRVPKKSPVLTLRTACVNVLLGTRIKPATCPKCKHEFAKQEELTGEKKAARYRLAEFIHNSNGLVELEAEKITIIILAI